MSKFVSSTLRICAASLLATVAFASVTFAAGPISGARSKQFGNGHPVTINDLPPGQLKVRLRTLPPRARDNALRWLQYISFTSTDLNLLRVDDGGGVYFEDSLRPDKALRRTSSAATGTVEAAYAPGNAFTLHSRPGATNKVFLDFDGHTFSNTAWGAAPIVAVAYSIDADRANFSDAERAAITSIWHRVSEDLAPFNIDVTTEEPATFNSTTGRVLITEDQDASGAPMPSSGAGGVAYVNVFGAGNYHTYYSPALVYAENLGPNVDTYIAEAASHEFGHNLGLSHDGTNAGDSYYSGHGSGLVSWAPIMGNSYYNNVTEWSSGEYADANQTQDDLAIIGAKLGFRADDHGNTIATGTPLSVAGDGTVDSSNPEIDPYNLLPQNKGVIGNRADADVFTFVSGSGPLSITVRPSWDAFYRATSRRGSNLDIQVELRDNANNVVATSDPVTDTYATVATTVASGTYHLVVTGVGNTVVPYSDYASLGQYFINGSITAGVADTIAPNPNPMTWASAPSPTSGTTIAMTASTAIDNTSTVQYRFNCVSGGSGCVASAWQSGTSYVASGLAPSTLYTFTVQARDASGNTTAASSALGATTDTPPPPPQYVNVVASSDVAVSGTLSGNYASTATDNGAVESITEVSSGGQPAKRYSQLEHRWTFTLGAGTSATVYANAWSSGSSDGDVFNFQYSTNGGGTWSTMFAVSSTNAGNVQGFVLPGAPSGAILIRVVDTNRIAGALQMNTISIDHLYVQVANPSNDPPSGNPSGLSATAVSSSRIDLAWTDGVSNEAGYRVERSPNGSTGWTLVAQLPNNSQSYSDTGLAASTTYYYRVNAYNNIASTAFVFANATTPVAPPQTLALTAVGSKSKGFIQIALSWTGGTNVDVYRNGSVVASAVNGTSYLDDTGSKAAGTYTNKVCVAGSSTNCSNTTSTVF